jgi:hypothetical protein
LTTWSLLVVAVVVIKFQEMRMLALAAALVDLESALDYL